MGFPKYEWRVGVVTKEGKIYSKNFHTKEECEEYVLEESEKHELKRVVILEKGNIKDREVINF